MVENTRGKDIDPQERLKKLQEEFDICFQIEDRTNPQSPWMHALSDLCDYYDSIVNKVIAGQEGHIHEEGLLVYVNRKSFGNDEYGAAHKDLFSKSARLLYAYETNYGGKGSIAKTRRFLVNRKNTYLREYKKTHGSNK